MIIRNNTINNNNKKYEEINQDIKLDEIKKRIELLEKEKV
jgi:hypothetical protein